MSRYVPPLPPDVCQVCAGSGINRRWDFDNHKDIVTDCRFCDGTGDNHETKDET